MVDRITQITDTKIQPYGMHVEDVRLKGINFPSQNKEKDPRGLGRLACRLL